MFGKILIVLLALGLGLLVLRSALGRSKRRDAPPPEQPADPDDHEAAPSRLYPCSQCGAMTPQEDVIWRDHQPYCSRDHAQL